MKLFYSIIAVSALAMNLSAQELWVNNPLSLVPTHLSWKEIESVNHNTDGSVQILKHNGADYTLDVNWNKGFQCVDAASSVLLDAIYSKMMVIRDITDIEQYDNGTLVGIVSEGDYSLDEFARVAYEREPLISEPAGQLMELNVKKLNLKHPFITKENLRIHQVGIAYVSTDVDGHKMLLTGNVVYPHSIGRKGISCSKIMLDNHMTIFNDGAKTPSMNFNSGALLQGAATLGYCVVQPDLIGLGIARNRTQLYVDKTVNPMHITDCMLAAMEYQEFSQYTAAPLLIDDDATLINTGGSQGATCSLATTYYIENVMDPAKRSLLPPLESTHLCAGAYDMKLTLNDYCRQDRVVFSPIVPLLMQGVFATHHNEMADAEGHPYRLHDYFNPILQNTTFDTSADGLAGNHTIWQMLDSKCLESGPLIAALVMACGQIDTTIVKVGCYSQISRMLASDMLKENGQGGYMLDENSPKVQAFARILEDNDLTDTNLWIPQSDIQMIHANDDYMVPYANSKQFYDRMYAPMSENGHVLELKTLENSDALGNHIVLCIIWTLSEISGLSIDTILKMI